MCTHTKHGAPWQCQRVTQHRIWHWRAPKAVAAREFYARRLHQSLPSPHGRFGCLSFEAKPSPSITALHRGTAGISHHHRTLLPFPSQRAQRRQAQLASPTLVPGTATTVALLTQDAQRGMAWLWFQAGVGKIRGMRRGTKTKIISFQPQRAKRESWGGEREAASTLQSRSDPRGTE